MTTACRSTNTSQSNLRPCALMRTLLAVGLLLVAATAAASPPQNIRFDRPFDQDEAARLGGLMTMVQDEFGFIWMGAENGLGRYDGRTLKLYQADRTSPRSLPGNFVWHLEVDRDGVFWQAGESGLSRYHPETDDFTHVTEIGGTQFASSVISALAVAEDNTLYAGGDGNLHIISPDRTSMSVHAFKPPVVARRGRDAQQIRTLAIDAGGRVWIGTAGIGVAIFDPTTKDFDYLVHEPENANSLADNYVRSIMHDDQGRVWLGTYGEGISRLNPDTGEFVHFVHDIDDNTSLGANIVLDITQDSEGDIWVALDQGGLALFDEASQSFHHYRKSFYDAHSVISNQLRVIYEDRNKDLWIGAFPSGASFYNRSTQVFSHYTNIADEPDSVSDNAITRMLQSDDGTIWVGTENGLNALDPKTGEFKRYMSDPADPQTLKAKPVLAIEEDIDGHLWIGTWAGGLHRFDPETGLFKRYPTDKNNPGGVQSDFIWEIILGKDGSVWIGTEDSGLYRYHRETESFSHYEADPNKDNAIAGNYVPALLEDSRGKLWVGTFNGLNIFDPETEIFTLVPYGTGQPNATNGKNIRSLYEDSRGLIWVGTEQHGVNIYDPKTNTFSHLGTADGLPSVNVSSILEDGKGIIWLGTTNGLARINVEDFSVSVFGREDGTAGSNFNRNASLKDHQGNLYFGSTEGITVFHPDDLDQAAADFPVYISQFRLFNQQVPIGTGNSPLHTSVLTADHIALGHADTMFSFDLVALNYRHSDFMRYSYMLEGFDRDWNNIGQNNTATYTNINPGKYTFRTRASTDGENWVGGQSLAITIMPPPWRTWQAYLLYAFLIGILLLFAQKYITLRVRAETYRSESITDPLTNLYNRAGIAQIAQGIFANAETKKGVCVMLIDIDHFKDINDNRGHDVGDKILCAIADVVRECLRNSDYVGRWGGEEFILLCATQDNDNSRLLAEKVRKAVESQTYEEKSPMHVTVSIGVTDLRSTDSFESALKRADNALYKAKRTGRNRVEQAES